MTISTCVTRVPYACACPAGDGGDGPGPAGAGLHLLLQRSHQREGERRSEDLLRPHRDEPLALSGEPHALRRRLGLTASPHAMATGPAEPAAERDCVCSCRSLCPVPYYAHTLGCSHTQSSTVGGKHFFVNVCVVLTLDLFGNYFLFL